MNNALSLNAYNVYFDFGTGVEKHIVIAPTPNTAISILSKQSGYNMDDYVTEVVKLNETR